MGLLALVLGAASILGPLIAGDLFTVLIGVVFLVSGASHVAYGLHAKDWRNLLHFLFLALGLLVGGVLILVNLRFARSGHRHAVGVPFDRARRELHRHRRGQSPAHPWTRAARGWIRNACLCRADSLALA